MKPNHHGFSVRTAPQPQGHSGGGWRLLSACVAIACLAAAGRAQITWSNAAGGDWNEPTNWDFGAVPAAGDTVNLTDALVSAYAVGYAAPMAAPSVYAVNLSANTAAQAITLTVAAGGFNVDDRISLGTNCTVVVEPGGALTVGTLEGRKGTLTLNGGTVTCLTAYTHGTGGKTGSPFTSRINSGAFTTPATTLGSSENGGTLTIAGGDVDLGVYSSGRDSGQTANRFNTGLIVNDGTVRLSGITLSTANSASSLLVAGGLVTNTGPFIIGNSSAGTARETGFRQTGGMVDTTAAGENIVLGNTANSQRVSLDVRGGVLLAHGVTLASDAAFTSVNATVSITDSGVVDLGAGGIINNATTYAVSLGNGGRLRATAAYTIVADLTLSGGVGTLDAADAQGAPLDLIIAGGLKGAGTLAKTGGGKVTLQGLSSHTGECQVREGTFAIEGSGSLSSAVISVAVGARLDVGPAFILNAGQSLAGEGTVAGAVTAIEGAGIRPAGNGVTGQLTLEAGLTLEGGVTATFDVKSAASKDGLLVGGALTLNGINTILVNSTLGSGTYRLIDYGTLVGDVASLQVVGVSGHIVNNAADGAIDLVIESTGRDPATLVWKGDGVLNQWDNGISKNWLNQAQDDWFFPNDTVRFDPTGSTTPAIELVGDLAPAAVLVDAPANYTLAGSGRIVGPAGLTKAGAGTLTLNTVNDYAGPTQIQGGVVRVSNLANGGVPSPMGSAGLDPANWMFDGGTVEYLGPSVAIDRGATFEAGGCGVAIADPAATLAWAGVLTGAGTLTKSGPGILELGNEANNYTGGTVVTGGTLLFGNTSSGAITLEGGTFATTADQQNLANTLNILGPDNYYRNTKNNTVTTLTGDGTLTLDFAAATDTITIEGDMSGFTGRIVAGGNSGNWRFYRFANPGSAAATFDLGTNSAVMLTRNGNTTVRLGSVTGDATTKLSGASSVTGALTTYEIGALNTSTTFDGAIEDSARPAPVGITKVGTGTLTLTAYSLCTGPTRIQEGTLALVESAGISQSSRYDVSAGATLDLSGLFDPTLYLAVAGQTLAGDGTVKGSVAAGADTTVAPGNPVGELTVTGTITLDGATVMELDSALTPNCDRIAAGQIVGNEIGSLVVTNVGGTLVAGDKFQLFSRPVSGGFASVQLPATDASGATYTWENNLGLDGSIRVLTATGGIPTTPTNLVVDVITPGTITVSWPPYYVGWALEAQTNTLDVGLSTNWVRIPASTTTSTLEFPIDPAHGAVFFRMVLP